MFNIFDSPYNYLGLGLDTRPLLVINTLEYLSVTVPSELNDL